MSTTTTNMSLTKPAVQSTAGPAWATELNSTLDTVDSHDHASGNGVQVTPSGININADLEFNENDATELRTVRFESQSAAITASSPDLSCTYVVSGDLYYNDSSGNQIQLTASGGLNGSSIGGIGGDYSTSNASLNYSDSTKYFTFLQAANTAAPIAVEDVAVYKGGASTNAATITYTGSNAITLTLPTVTGTIAILGANTFTGAQTISDSTASTTKDTGCFIVQGGVGVEKDIFTGGSIDIAASKSYGVAGTAILSDSAGTMTLSNIDALDATTETTIEAAIDTLSSLTTVGALNAGSITSGFGSIDVGSSAITTTGTASATTFVGALTGDASGTAATVTGATQAAITTCANLVTIGTIAGFTSTGIDDNATSTAITIDSSERIGIGTAIVTTAKLNLIGNIRVGSGSSAGSTRAGNFYGTITTVVADNAANTLKSSTAGAGALMVVWGTYAANSFSDLVLLGATSAIVISSNDTAGSPGARTYTASSETFKVAINDSSNEYSVHLTGLGANEETV